jgi:glucan endo-1,3-alpha-glucosidase
VFICENLPTLRWEQMLSMQPDLIEIISWNGMLISEYYNSTFKHQLLTTKSLDYGESHYIGPYSGHHSDDGSSQWAAGMPHDGWRDLYQPYIAAYKAGANAPTVDEEKIVYWYRPTPKSIICTGDPLPAPNGIGMLSDSVFVTTMLKSPANLTVISGSNEPAIIPVPAGIVTSNVTMGVGNQSFTVTRVGQTLLSGKGGLAIEENCTKYNFNVYVGKITS